MQFSVSFLTGRVNLVELQQVTVCFTPFVNRILLFPRESAGTMTCILTLYMRYEFQHFTKKEIRRHDFPTFTCKKTRNKGLQNVFSLHPPPLASPPPGVWVWVPEIDFGAKYKLFSLFNPAL